MVVEREPPIIRLLLVPIFLKEDEIHTNQSKSVYPLSPLLNFFTERKRGREGERGREKERDEEKSKIYHTH